MEIVKSPYVTQFNKMAAEILEGYAEAVSNFHYLGILREPFEKVHESIMKEIPDQIQNILWLLRVIWLNSPYYNSRERLNGLFRRISNLLILKCIDEIDVEMVFDGHSLASEVVLNECLTTLLFWKKKYMEAQRMHRYVTGSALPSFVEFRISTVLTLLHLTPFNSNYFNSMNSYASWLLEYDKIFAHVDAFVQRIRDLLELCLCQRLYGRRLEGKQEDLPLYPGTKAPDITRVLREVTRMFDKQLDTLHNYSNLVLDVRNASWHEQMNVFRTAVKDMEMMIQNILMSALDSASNLEQGVMLLECFYTFYQRDLIIRAYDKLTVKLYKIFDNDMIQVKDLYAKNILPLPLVYPQLSGRGAWALYMKQRLDENYECLRKAWVSGSSH